ncbi:MAG: transcriptional repressor, partial [Oscillospiraceae bacterium]
MTKQRKIIYDIIMASTHHLTAEDIFLRAKKVNPTIAMGTVYRNLGLMCEDKEITKLVIPGAADRYDKSATPHQHLTCSVCGRIKDVEFNNFP